MSIPVNTTVNAKRFSVFTPDQVVNLAKLASYLESLPADYKHFDMTHFLKLGPEKQPIDDERPYDERLDDDRYYNYAINNGGLPECGSVACAVGHGPAAGILFDENDRNLFTEPMWDDESVRPSWDAYSHRYLIPEEEYALQQWCFGGGWFVHDNTHRGAAARIRFLLAGEELPLVTDWRGHLMVWKDTADTLPEHVDLYSKYLVA